jgi:hypothetical protein
VRAIFPGLHLLRYSFCVIPLTSLGGDESLIILTRKRNDLHGVLKTAVQGVGESDGESRGQKIDINLKMPRGIKPVKPHNAAAAVG